MWIVIIYCQVNCKLIKSTWVIPLKIPVKYLNFCKVVSLYLRRRSFLLKLQTFAFEGFILSKVLRRSEGVPFKFLFKHFSTRRAEKVWQVWWLWLSTVLFKLNDFQSHKFLDIINFQNSFLYYTCWVVYSNFLHMQKNENARVWSRVIFNIDLEDIHPTFKKPSETLFKPSKKENLSLKLSLGSYDPLQFSSTTPFIKYKRKKFKI